MGKQILVGHLEEGRLAQSEGQQSMKDDGCKHTLSSSRQVESGC